MPHISSGVFCLLAAAALMGAVLASDGLPLSGLILSQTLAGVLAPGLAGSLPLAASPPLNMVLSFSNMVCSRWDRKRGCRELDLHCPGGGYSMRSWRRAVPRFLSSSSLRM